MCGRFSFAISKKIIEEHYGFAPAINNLRYNCAPSQSLAVISNLNPNDFSYFKWGFIPFWDKDDAIGYKMINARAETITTKPAFKRSLQTNRCLIPADSFYEWSHDADKTPYRIMLADKAVFSMAGIWSEWRSPQNEVVLSFAIITTEANTLIKPLHDRMPVIFDRQEAEISWLNKEFNSDVFSLLKPLGPEKMKVYPVSKKVNSPKNDTHELHLLQAGLKLF